MPNRSSRMKLPTRLIACTALAIVGAAALSTPASAVRVIPKNTVMAVCKRTAGCWSDTTTDGSVTYGCGSPNSAVAGPAGDGCFVCDNKKGKCYSGRLSTVVGMHNRQYLIGGGGSSSSSSPSRSKSP